MRGENSCRAAPVGVWVNRSPVGATESDSQQEMAYTSLNIAVKWEHKESKYQYLGARI